MITQILIKYCEILLHLFFGTLELIGFNPWRSSRLIKRFITPFVASSLYRGSCFTCSWVAVFYTKVLEWFKVWVKVSSYLSETCFGRSFKSEQVSYQNIRTNTKSRHFLGPLVLVGLVEPFTTHLHLDGFFLTKHLEM